MKGHISDPSTMGLVYSIPESFALEHSECTREDLKSLNPVVLTKALPNGSVVKVRMYLKAEVCYIRNLKRRQDLDSSLEIDSDGEDQASLKRCFADLKVDCTVKETVTKHPRLLEDSGDLTD